MTAREIRDEVRGGRRSAVEIARERLDRVNPALNAFLTLDEEEVLARAAEIDRKKEKGLLAGVPVAVKDNICVRGARTTCGSKALEAYVPPYDATVIARLRAADAILFGKTNMDEFGMGSSTEHSAFGPTRNPFDPDRVAGGSSGGSAAAVASDVVPLALGSDTGGSIRQPAAFCGVVGFKPTYGRVSRYGLVAFASSLDQIGPLADNVEDAALLFRVIQGGDPSDATSVDNPWSDVERPPAGLRVGVPREHFGDGLDPEVRGAVEEAIARVESRGARRIEVSLPTTPYAIAAYYLVAPSEASSNLARFDGVHFGRRAPAADDLRSLYTRSRHEGFGREVTRRILLGTFALSSGYYDAYYKRALKARRVIKEDFDRVFREVDIVVGPTTPTAAFRLGEKRDDPLAMYLCDVYTVAANLAGLPAISLPCGRTKTGLPIGMQLIGRAFEDETLLAAARSFEGAIA